MGGFWAVFSGLALPIYMQPGEIPPLLLPKLSCIFIPCIKSVTPKVFLAQVLFTAFLGPYMNTKKDVVIYTHLEHSTDYIDSINIHGFIVLTP